MSRTYSLPEAVRILRVSPQELSELMAAGTLEVITDPDSGARRVTMKSVHLEVERSSRQGGQITYPEYRELTSRLDRMQDHLYTMAAVLQAPAPPRAWTDEDLLLLLEYAYNMTAVGAFHPNDIFSFVDRVMTLRWQEVGRLSELRGEGAWRVIFGLINDMLLFLETEGSNPEQVRILSGQLHKALDYLVGLFGTAHVFETDLPKRPTVRMLDTLHMPLNEIDSFIVSGIKATARAVNSEAWKARIARERGR